MVTYITAVPNKSPLPKMTLSSVYYSIIIWKTHGDMNGMIKCHALICCAGF